METTAHAEPATGGWTRHDTVAAALCVAAALAVRLPGVGDLALTHFDESAYAISARAVAEGTFARDGFPQQSMLSPPAFFGIAGTAMRLAGSASQTVLFGVAVAFGALLPGVVYAAARGAAGRAAAVAAALLVAFADVHVLFSRTGLTDAAFCALLIAACLALVRAIDTGSAAWTVAGGVLTGCAWNTKYHGWLAVVVVGASLLPSFRRLGVRGLAGPALRLAAAGAVAALLYVPWYLHVDSEEGGYARLAANHARFLKPLGAPRSAATHFVMQQFLDGWMSRIAPAAALVAAAVASRGARALRSGALWTAAAGLAAAATAAGSVTVVALVALAGCVRLVRAGTRTACMVLALLAVFTVLTPLYHPYARLLLPWLAAAAVAAGSGLVAIAAACDDPRTARRVSVGSAAAVLASCGFVAFAGLRRAADPWQAPAGFERAAQEIHAALPPGEPVVVLGEPAVVFHLRRLGRTASHVNRPVEVAGAAAGATSVAVAIGRYGRLLGEFEAWRAERAADVQAAGRYAAEIGDVRILDDYRPSEWAAHRADPRGDHDLDLYRVRLTAAPR